MKKILSSLLAISLLLVSCVETEYETPSYDLGLESGITSVVVPQPDGSVVEYPLTFTRDITISYESEWLEVVQDDSKLVFTALSDNLFDTPRSTEVTLSADYSETTSFTVTQSGIVPLEFDLGVETLDVSFTLGAVIELPISTNTVVDSMELDQIPSWLSVTKGVEAYTLTVIEGNPETTSRTDTLAVHVGSGFWYSADTLVLTQLGSAEYTLSVDKTDLAMKFGGDTDAIAITTTATSLEELGVYVTPGSESWLSVDYTLTSLTVTALADNMEDGDRSATITLSAGTSDPVVITAIQEVSFDFVKLQNEEDSIQAVAAKRNNEVQVALSTNVVDDSIVLLATYDEGVYEWVDASVVDGYLVIKANSSNGTGSTGIGGERTATVTATVGDFVATVYVTQAEDTDYQGYPNAAALTVGQLSPDSLGIVYYVDPDDNTCGKAFSLSQIKGKLSDNTIDVYTDGISIDEYNGAANTAAIVATSGYSETTFYGIYWTLSIGDHWYMPSYYELSDLLTIMWGAGDDTDGFDSTMNSYITNAAGDPFLCDGTQYYTNSFRSATNIYGMRPKYTESEGVVTITSIGSYSSSAANSRHIRAIQVIGSCVFEEE